MPEVRSKRKHPKIETNLSVSVESSFDADAQSRLRQAYELVLRVADEKPPSDACAGARGIADIEMNAEQAAEEEKP